jgi:hypothetical protein
MRAAQPVVRFLTLILLMPCVLAICGSGSVAFCSSLHGIYALANHDRPMPSAVLDNTNVDGLALRYWWDELEPREGIFNWWRIDSEISAAQTHGKTVSLGITAGVHTPAWVYDAGAAFFTFTWKEHWGYRMCSSQRMPIPWDPVYLAKWRSFVRALGARYAKNPTVVYVKITGINSTTQETILPHSRNAKISDAGVSCVSSDDVATWLAVGYSRYKVEQAWKQIGDSFAQAFPEARLGLMVVPAGFPPIDETGNLLPGKKRDAKIALNLITRGLTSYGSRFVVQNNGLSATYSWEQLTRISRRSTVGYQMLWSATKDAGCRMNGHRSPCDPRVVLLEAVDRGLASGASFLEVYLSDIMNPQLRGVIASAHRDLASRALRQVSQSSCTDATTASDRQRVSSLLTAPMANLASSVSLYRDHHAPINERMADVPSETIFRALDVVRYKVSRAPFIMRELRTLSSSLDTASACRATASSNSDIAYR